MARGKVRYPSTGEVLCAPAYGDVTRYNVRVTGADIEVEV